MWGRTDSREPWECQPGPPDTLPTRRKKISPLLRPMWACWANTPRSPRPVCCVPSALCAVLSPSLCCPLPPPCMLRPCAVPTLCSFLLAVPLCECLPCVDRVPSLPPLFPLGDRTRWGPEKSQGER